MSFEQAIDTIEMKVVDLTSVSDLLVIDQFKSIYSHSNEYLEDAKIYLNNSSKSEQKKEIVVYSMQNLEYNNYIIFFKECALLYERKRISEDIMLSVISPGFEWNNKIVNNFYKTNIRKTLNDIKKVGSCSERFRNIIDQILYGKIWFYNVISYNI